MFYKNSVKKYVTYPLFGLGLGLVLSAHLQAAANRDLISIKKDIRVISKIIESSTELTNSRGHPRVNGTYLAEQGIVLNIRFPGRSHPGFPYNSGDFREFVGISAVPDADEINAIVSEAMEQARENWPTEIAPMPPMPPIPDHIANNDNNKFSKEIKAYRTAKKALYKEQRALAKQARNFSKKIRKLSKKKQRKQIKSQEKALKKNQLELTARKNELKRKLVIIKKKQRQNRQINYNNWKQNVISTFCEYAPYPKNLPKKEHLTFIFKNASFIDNKKSDSILVLTNTQLKDCRNGKINGGKLLKIAQQYNF